MSFLGFDKKDRMSVWNRYNTIIILSSYTEVLSVWKTRDVTWSNPEKIQLFTFEPLHVVIWGSDKARLRLTKIPTPTWKLVHKFCSKGCFSSIHFKSVYLSMFNILCSLNLEYVSVVGTYLAVLHLSSCYCLLWFTAVKNGWRFYRCAPQFTRDSYWVLYAEANSWSYHLCSNCGSNTSPDKAL